jgi:hypothetical protein
VQGGLDNVITAVAGNVEKATTNTIKVAKKLGDEEGLDDIIVKTATQVLKGWTYVPRG